MKRIVVITECRRFAFNFGETLQAVATSKVISQMGFQCQVMSYENEKIAFQDSFLPNLRKYLIRALKFEWFRVRNMSYPVRRSNQKEDFEKVLQTAAGVICGSDCIWYEKDYNAVFFLDFPQVKIPKIAYAPSLRDDIIKDPRYTRNVKRWIRGIDFLSTREEGGSQIISEISGRKVETVLDPTLLLSQKEWNCMSAKRVVKEPYILVYILGKTQPVHGIASQVKKEYPHRKIIWIRMEKNDGYRMGKAIWNIGPAQFISLVRYADAVVTDSFHGTAFSIIYQKPFYSVKRFVDKNDVYDNDCRIKNILKKLEINNYFCCDDKIDFSEYRIDYQNVERKLEQERKKSLRYLRKALETVKRT